MASWHDLHERLEQTIAADPRLHTHAAYRSQALPSWLSTPIDEADANAGERVPVCVLNVKGHGVDGAVCVLSLADLERLIDGG